jgi:hypothetical protein
LVIVIGRYPIYLDVAKDLGARAFNIPASVWDSMTADQQWRANADFLDEAIAAGEEIILATPPEKIPPDCTLEKELNYLASHGFLPKFIKGRWEVVKVR